MSEPQDVTKEESQRFPDELTVVKEDGSLIATISLVEGNAIVANGYKVLGYDKT